jgi:hypothetical protein
LASSRAASTAIWLSLFTHASWHSRLHPLSTPHVRPARSPNLNAYAERWVRSIKEECLAKLILFGERSLQRVVSNYLEHYHQERNH